MACRVALGGHAGSASRVGVSFFPVVVSFAFSEAHSSPQQFHSCVCRAVSRCFKNHQSSFLERDINTFLFLVFMFAIDWMPLNCRRMFCIFLCLFIRYSLILFLIFLLSWHWCFSFLSMLSSSRQVILRPFSFFPRSSSMRPLLSLLACFCCFVFLCCCGVLFILRYCLSLMICCLLSRPFRLLLLLLPLLASMPFFC